MNVTPARMCFLLALYFALVGHAQAEAKIIVAERGAGKYLVEHSLPAATLAAARRVDFIELHVVMTADAQLVVFHDLTLDRLTDVSTIFPERKRQDGAAYVIDFTLKELRTLRILGPTGKTEGEIPLALSIPTLAEELSLLRHLETIFDRQIGIVVEIRQPWFHHQAGTDISSAVLNILAQFGYVTGENKLYLQCFDPEELQRIHGQLMPEREMNLPLIQLVGANDGQETRIQGSLEPYNYDWIFTNIGLRMVASYAAAIALPANILADPDGNLPLAAYVGEAHRHGLMVLARFFNSMPPYPAHATNLSALIDFYFSRVGIDGMYTDMFIEVQQAMLGPRQGTNENEAPLVDGERVSPGEEGVPPQHDDLPPFFKNLNLSRPGSHSKEAGQAEDEKALSE